jgi:hypothetical protein
MSKTQLSKQLVGFSGEHYVASKIGLMGYVPLMTSSISSQYPGSDISVLNFSNGKKVDVQVKTMSYQKKINWYVPEEIEGMDAIFVFNKISEDKKSIASYVVKSSYVAKESKKQRDEYIANHPNVNEKQPRMISEDSLREFSEKWDIFEEILGNPQEK